MENILLDYKFSYNAMEDNDAANIWNITRSFKMRNSILEDPKDFYTTRMNMRDFDDNWIKIRLDIVLKSAGIATGLSLPVIALITGLALGLKRSRNNTTPKRSQNQ